MSRFMLSYTEGSSVIHRLCGATKFIFFLLWSAVAMTTYDTRIMAAMALLALVLFGVSRVRWREVSFIFALLLLFMGFNLIAIYIFAPEQGVEVYRTRHLLFAGYGRFTVTAEQLFYLANVLLKYCVIVPPALLLIVTTHPGEFASSLNRIGVSYSIAYAVSLTLRYIPDVQRVYLDISRAQQARGIELSSRASWVKRLKGAAAILMPLLFNSLERIDVVSTAMILRGFGKNRRRTWYSYKPFTFADIAVITVSVLLTALCLWITFKDGDRFYNPFI